MDINKMVNILYSGEVKKKVDKEYVRRNR